MTPATTAAGRNGMSRRERRLRVASLLVLLGMAIEALSFTRLHPLAWRYRLRHLKHPGTPPRQQGPRSLHLSLGADAGSGLGPASGSQRATSDEGT